MKSQQGITVWLYALAISAIAVSGTLLALLAAAKPWNDLVAS